MAKSFWHRCWSPLYFIPFAIASLFCSHRSSFLVISRLWPKQIMIFICILAVLGTSEEQHKRLKLKTRFARIYNRNLHKTPCPSSPCPAPGRKRCFCQMHKSSKYTRPPNRLIRIVDLVQQDVLLIRIWDSIGESASKMENANVILMKTAAAVAAELLCCCWCYMSIWCQ